MIWGFNITRSKGILLAVGCLSIAACSVLKLPYTVTKGAVKSTYYVVKGSYELTAGTVKVAYKIGGFTFKVIKAPLDWQLTHDVESVDGISPKEAIRQGRVKTAPYSVKGKRYYPMSIDEMSKVLTASPQKRLFDRAASKQHRIP